MSKTIQLKIGNELVYPNNVIRQNDINLTVYTTSGAVASLIRTGNVVTFSSNYDMNNVAQGVSNIGTIPAGYRPLRDICIGINNNPTLEMWFTIYVSGVIRMYSSQAITSAINSAFCVTWITGDDVV